jgi:hypothetical protein
MGTVGIDKDRDRIPRMNKTDSHRISFAPTMIRDYASAISLRNCGGLVRRVSVHYDKVIGHAPNDLENVAYGAFLVSSRHHDGVQGYGLILDLLRGTSLIGPNISFHGLPPERSIEQKTADRIATATTERRRV